MKDDRKVRLIKGTLIALCFFVSISSFGAQLTNQLYPWLPVMLAASAFLLLLVGNQIGIVAWISGAIFVGVSYRIITYWFSASMVWADPDKVALAVHRIMEQGSIDAISELNFYYRAPGSHILNSEIGLVLGVDSRFALSIYGLLLAVGVPLFTAVITKQIVENWQNSKTIAIGIATTIALVATNVILYGYAPIPQLLAVLLWLAFILSMSRYYQSGSNVDKALSLIFPFSIIFVHKLGVVLIVSVMVLASSLLFINRIRISHDVNLQDQTSVKGIIFLLGVFLAFQWLFLTEWGRIVLFASLLPLLDINPVPAAPEVTYGAAVPIWTGLSGILVRNIHWMVSVPIAGIAAVICWWRSVRPTVSLLLSAVMVCGFLLFVSIFSPGAVTTQRILLYIEPVFAIVVAVACAGAWCSMGRENSEWRDNRSRWQQSAAVIILIVFVLSQTVSPYTVPDHPSDAQAYLTNQEVEGKMFALEYATEPVSTDYYYALETIDFNRPSASIRTGELATRGLSEFALIDEALLNGTISANDHPYVLYREQDIYWTSVGRYRLVWDPNKTLSNETSYNVVYSNGDTTMFRAG